MVRQHDKILNQLQNAMTECATLRGAAQELQRENTVLRKVNSDLSIQVQALVEETTEEFRSRSESEIAVITFRNVKELQSRNEELIRQVRTLQYQHEQDLQRVAEENYTAALRELEKLRDARLKVEERLLQVAKERDRYRSLLQDARAWRLVDAADSGVELALTSGQTQEQQQQQQNEQASQTNTELLKTVRELQEEFDSHRREKQTNDQMLQEEIDRRRDESSSLREQLARSTSRADFVEGRCKQLEDNLALIEKDTNATKKRNMELSSSIVEHQRKLDQLREELVTTRSELKQANSLLSNLRVEKEVLRNGEIRTRTEINDLLQQKTQLQSLLDNLNRMYSTQQETDAETKRTLSHQLSIAQSDSQLLRKQLDEERGKHRTYVENMEAEHKDLRFKFESREQTLQQLKDELSAARGASDALNTQIARLRQDLQVAEDRVKDFLTPSGDPASPEYRLRAELDNLKLEFANVKDELEQAKGDTESYKSIARSSEETLKDVQIEFTALKSRSSTLIEEGKKENESVSSYSLPSSFVTRSSNLATHSSSCYFL
jgi:chromosome segregation ATPase